MNAAQITTPGEKCSYKRSKHINYKSELNETFISYLRSKTMDREKDKENATVFKENFERRIKVIESEIDDVKNLSVKNSKILMEILDELKRK